MKRILTLAVGLMFTSAVFGYQVGDQIPNICWKNAEETNVCLDSSKNTIRVIDFNAGWCPPCNTEMTKLARRVGNYSKQPVTFISASIAGWRRGSSPSASFLREWQAKHNIPASVQVLASTRGDFLALAEPSYYIPNFVILDESGTLVYRSSNVGVDGILAKVEDLLGKKAEPTEE